MEASDLPLFLPLFFGALVLFFVVLFIFLARHRRVEQPGAALSDPTPTPGPYGGHTQLTGTAAGRWNGEILGNGVMGAVGGTLGSTFGVFEVREGVTYPHRHQLESLERLDLGDDWLRAVCHDNAAALLTEQP